MRTYKVDVGIIVRADSAEDAASIIGSILSAGQNACDDLYGPGAFRPAFIGVRPPSEPDEPEQPKQPEPADQAQDLFARIMAGPSIDEPDADVR